MRVLGLWALLLGLSLVGRLPLLTAPYHYDDHIVIERNALIQDLSHVPDLLRGRVDSGDEMNGAYRPLLMITYAVWGAATGHSAAGYRLLGFALHAANALLVLGLAGLAFRLPWMFAAWAAAVFLLHPMQNQNLALVWKQSDAWAAFFFLATAWLWLRQRAPAWIFPPAFVMALGFKESAVVLPFFWLALERFRSPRKRHLLAALACAFAAVAYLWLRGRYLPAPRITTDGNPFSGTQYFLTQLRVLPQYLAALLLPGRATLDRAIPMTLTAGPYEWAMIVALVGALAAATWSWSRGFAASLLAIGALLWLAPTSSFQPLALLYDETRMYLVIGFLAIGAALALRRALPELGIRPGIALAILPCVAGTAANLRDMPRWTSEEGAWRRAIDVDPCATRAHHELGAIYERERAYDDAEAAYLAGLRCSPDFAPSMIRLGIVLGKKGDLAGAETAFARALGASPPWSAEAAYHLGLARIYRGDGKAAREFFRRARELDPQGGLCENGMQILLKRPVTDCGKIED